MTENQTAYGADFKVGDVVRMKNGGPLLCIAEIYEDVCSCAHWCNGEAKEIKCPAAMLERSKNCGAPLDNLYKEIYGEKHVEEMKRKTETNLGNYA